MSLIIYRENVKELRRGLDKKFGVMFLVRNCWENKIEDGNRGVRRLEDKVGEDSKWKF